MALGKFIVHAEASDASFRFSYALTDGLYDFSNVVAVIVLNSYVKLCVLPCVLKLNLFELPLYAHQSCLVKDGLDSSVSGGVTNVFVVKLLIDGVSKRFYLEGIDSLVLVVLLLEREKF